MPSTWSQATGRAAFSFALVGARREVDRVGKVSGIGLVLLLVVCVWALWSLGRVTPQEAEVRTQAEATRLAIENERAEVELRVQQGTAQARIAAKRAFLVALVFAGSTLVVLLALVIPLWLYNRASMAYPRGGIYPIVVRQGLRGVTIYDANRLPGPNGMVTSQAQAIQLAAVLAEGGGMTAQERSAAMQEIGRAFQPGEQGAAVYDPPIVHSPLTVSHVERLLLEGGDDDDND